MVEEGKDLLTITEGGYGKRTPYDDFREMKNRGGHGVTCHKISDKSGKLCSIASVSEDDDVMMITDQGTIIRIPVSGINVYSRTASGVIVMRLAEGSSIINFARLEREEEIEKQSAEAEAADVSLLEEEEGTADAPEKEDVHLPAEEEEMENEENGDEE